MCHAIFVLCSGVSGISSPPSNSCVVIKNCMPSRFSMEVFYVPQFQAFFQLDFYFLLFLFGQFMATDNSLAMKNSRVAILLELLLKEFFIQTTTEMRRESEKEFLFKYFKWNYFTSRSWAERGRNCREESISFLPSTQNLSLAVEKSTFRKNTFLSITQISLLIFLHQIKWKNQHFYLQHDVRVKFSSTKHLWWF